jgi:hypothetical protein
MTINRCQIKKGGRGKNGYWYVKDLLYICLRDQKYVIQNEKQKNLGRIYSIPNDN